MDRTDTLSSQVTAVLVSGDGIQPVISAASSTETYLEKSASHIHEASVTAPPDGGREAWTVVFASTLALFASFGVVNSYGIFQSYYTNTLLTNTSSAKISLIGSLQLFLIYGLGPVVGRVFDAFGTRALVPTGSALLVISLVLTSFCQRDQAWQFFLAQGTLFGIGGALVFTPGYAVVGQWFRRRRSLALGISGSGACVGGAVTPIILQQLIPIVGFRWAVRILALMVFICLSIACTLLKPRLPLKRKVAAKDIVDLHGFRDAQYCLAAVGSFLYFFVLFIPFFYIQDYGTFHNVNSVLLQYLVALMNIMGMPARVGLGLIADRVGILNVLLPCALTCSVLILALWMPSREDVPIALFSALYGLFSGPFVSLTPAYIATRTPPENFGARLGTIFLVEAVATLVGPVVAGAFLPTFTQPNFNKLITFTGVMTLAGTACLGVAYILSFREKRVVLTGTVENPNLATAPSVRSGKHETDLEKNGQHGDVVIVSIVPQSSYHTEVKRSTQHVDSR